MSGISSPSSLMTVNAMSTEINILSLLKLGAGCGAFIAPAFFTQRVFGFTQRTTKGAGASTASTVPHPGSPEEQSLAIRLFGARDIALGLLLRDSTAAVVARTLQANVISSVLDVASCVFGFVEGNLSREVATAVGALAGLEAAWALWILRRA